MNFTLIGFIIYLIAMIAVGLWTYAKNESHTDFFLGGRKMNPWVVAFSERASGESAWLLLGLPGAAFAVGLLEMWTAVGCVSGIIFSWYVIAKELRVETQRYDAITLPAFFAAKFGKNADIIRFLSMLIVIFFFTFYLAAQFNGAGKVLHVTFGISHMTGMIIGTVVIIFYTMMGGFFAVAWTDLIQGIIMIGTLVILPIAGFIEISSSGASLSNALSSAGSSFASLTAGKTGWVAVAAVIGGLSWGLGYIGQPHLLTRFMSIKDPEQIKVSRRIAIAWAVPAFVGSMIIGVVGLSMVKQGLIPAIHDRESIMPLLTTHLLPGWLAGIFISGAIAAMMSTADSQLLVISSSVIEDFFHKTLKKEISDAKMLQLSRIITVSIGLIGFAIAATSDKLIFTLVSYAWSGLGASFGPALLLMLRWKKTTGAGVIAGMLTGTISTVIWASIPALDTFLTHRLVAFVFAFIAVVIVSLITTRKN